MPIERIVNGVIHEFPDGTPESKIQEELGITHTTTLLQRTAERLQKELRLSCQMHWVQPSRAFPWAFLTRPLLS